MNIETDEFKLFITVFLGLSLGSFTVFSAPLYIGTLIDGYAFTKPQAGLVNSLEIGSLALVALVLSNRLNQVSLRSYAAVAMLITLTANVVTFAFNDYSSILIIRTIAGAGVGVCLAVSSVLLSRANDPDRMMAVVLASVTLLMIIALPIMGHISEKWNFNGVIALFTLIILIFIPLVPFTPSLDAQGKQTLIQNEEESTSNKSIPVNRHLVLGILGLGLIFIFCMLDSSIWAYSERSGYNLGLDYSDIGLILALAQIMGLVSSFLVVVIGNKLPRMLPIASGILLMGVASLFIYKTDSQFIYSISMACCGFGFFLTLPYLIGSCARLDQDGRWAVRANSITMLGGAVAPFAAGNVSASRGLSALGIYCILLAFISLILAFVFTQQINKTDKSSLY